MLKGIKIKNKKTEEIKEENKEKEIKEILQEEKKISAEEYNLNLLRNVKKSEMPDRITEIVAGSAMKKKPVSLKSLKCQNCSDSSCFTKYILYSDDFLHVSMPEKGSLVKGHLIISPNHHALSSTELDPDEVQEIQDIKKIISKFYRTEYAKKGIFVENFNNPAECEHMIIDCFPISPDLIEQAYCTVFQELNSADDEWTDNKKIIIVNDNIQKSVPKGFSYLHCDFDMKKGIAHIIENKRKIRKDFSYKIFAEILGIDLLYIHKKHSEISMQLAHKELFRKWNDLAPSLFNN